MYAWILDKKTASTIGLYALGSILSYVCVPNVASFLVPCFLKVYLQTHVII